MGLVAKAFQDIITFSRATAGTYVNSNGYITNSSVLNYLTYSNAPDNAAWTKSNSFVQTNLLTYSQELDNAAWNKLSGGTGVVPVVTANYAVAPDGTLTADRVVFDRGTGTSSADVSYIQQNVTSVSADCTGSFWLRTTDGSTKNITLRVGTATFNYAVTVTGTWTRVSLTGVSPITRIDLLAYGDRGPQVIDLLVWGAQLVQGSVPGDYQATTSAALPVLYADYQGNLRARKLCEAATTASHNVSTSVTVAAGTVYTLSVKLKAAERGFAQVRYENGGSTEFFAANVNLATGAYTTSTFGTPTQTNAVVTMLENGYWLVSISAAASNTTFVTAVFLQSALGTNSYTGDGSSGIYIADAQLNDGSTALAYYDTTQYAYNAPRFDYDPVTLAAKGLLIEEQRANLLLQSNDFATTWTPSRATVTSNAVLSPDGAVTADKLIATAVAGTHRVYQSGITNSGTTTRTLSAYFKAAEYSYAGLMLSDATESDQNRVQWNLATGATTNSPVGTTITLVSSSMQTLSNGWVRCIMTCTVDAAEPSITAWLFVIDNTNASTFTGDGVSGVYAYGAQLETGAFATSYIPTTTSQFTRAADVASVNTLSPWFNAVAGTLYVESIANAASPANQYLATLNDGTTNNRVTLFKATGGTANSRVTAAGVASNPTAPATTIAGITSKVALTFSTAASGVNIYVNGTAGTAVTAAATPAGILRLGLGLDETASTSFLNGHLRRVTFYPRQMTSGEGTALTTL